MLNEKEVRDIIKNYPPGSPGWRIHPGEGTTDGDGLMKPIPTYLLFIEYLVLISPIWWMLFQVIMINKWVAIPMTLIYFMCVYSIFKLQESVK